MLSTNISALYRQEQDQLQQNRDTVEEFREFCFRYPHMRFWQAVASWSNQGYIYASDTSPLEFEDAFPTAVFDDYFQDTYYWKGKEA